MLRAARARIEIVVLLLALAGLAWWSTVDQMAGMNAGPGTDLGSLDWFIGTWIVMMTAMMLPSLTPTAAAHAALRARREPSTALLFACGYLVIWVFAGIVAYAVFGLGRDLTGHLSWRGSGRWLAASALALAAIYEASSIKNACLLRCRDPLTEPQTPRLGDRMVAFVLGQRNGLWCLGSSWNLMAALFALGVMSVTWMAIVAALVAVQKLAPWLPGARLGTVALLSALTLAIILWPGENPGLVVPLGRQAQPMSMGR